MLNMLMAYRKYNGDARTVGTAPRKGSDTSDGKLLKWT